MGGGGGAKGMLPPPKLLGGGLAPCPPLSTPMYRASDTVYVNDNAKIYTQEN